MRYGFLASLTGLLVGAGAVLAQPPKPPPAEKLPVLPEKVKEMPEKPNGKAGKTADPRAGAPLPGGAPIPGPGDGPDILRGSDAGYWTPHGQLWTSAEFLLMWTKEPRPIPQLVSGTVFVPSTGEGDPGGEQTGTLIGGTPDFRAMGGARFSAGYWFQADRHLGVETSLLYLGKESEGGPVPPTPRQQRTFINFQTGEPAEIIIAAPGIAAGGIGVTVSQRAWGLETNLLKCLSYEPIFKCLRLDLIAGFRYLDLAEDLRVERATSFAPDLTATPAFLAFQSNRILERESIRTHNSFFGPQAGVASKLFFGDLVVIDARVKLAAGVNHERLILQGQQTRIRPDGRQTTAPGALLALPSNIGRRSREQFDFVPEITANIGIPINNYVGVYGGYTFIYWNRVIRPSDQVDRVVDVSQIPNFPPPIPASTGLGRPGAPFNQVNWWMQGINLGVEIHW